MSKELRYQKIRYQKYLQVLKVLRCQKYLINLVISKVLNVQVIKFCPTLKLTYKIHLIHIYQKNIFVNDQYFIYCTLPAFYSTKFIKLYFNFKFLSVLTRPIKCLLLICSFSRQYKNYMFIKYIIRHFPFGITIVTEYENFQQMEKKINGMINQ